MPDQQQTLTHVRVANAELVRQFIHAINDSWNIDAMRDLVSEDFRFVIPVRARVVSGPLRRPRGGTYLLEQREELDGS